MTPVLVNDSLHTSDESFTLHHTPTSISLMAIFSLIFFLGLPGNSLVIWVVTLKMKPTVNTTWFLHLAVADFVCCLTLPFNIVQLALHNYWPYGWFFCKIIPSAILLNMFASVFLLTVISIDRWLVVTKPVWCQNHRTVRFASLLCGSIWVLAFVMCFPAFFYRETSIDELGNTKCIYNWHGEEPQDSKELDGPFPSDDLFLIGPSLMAGEINEAPSTDGFLDMYPEYHILSTTEKTKFLPSSILNSTETYYDDYLPEIQLPSAFVSVTITRSVLGFLLPFGITATCYAIIAHKMLNNQFAKARRKSLQTILLIIVAFFLCWTPYHLTGLLYLLSTPSIEFSEVLAFWDHISIALAYANSCINPLIYVFMGKKFREKAHQTVQGFFEAAFSEEDTGSTAISQNRSKATLDRNVDISFL